MKFLDFRYYDGIDYHKIPITESFKIEAVRLISKELKRLFDNRMDMKLTYFAFNDFLYTGQTIMDKLPKTAISPNISTVDDFIVGYGGGARRYHFKLTIKNNLNEEKVDISKEIQKDEYSFILEAYPEVYESLSKYIDAINTRKNIKYFTEYPFGVKIIHPGLDCEIKVKFNEPLTKESKAEFINNALEAISEFNEANEKGGDSKGLIHNVLKVKSENNTSDNLTFVVDLGSAGEDGLRVFFNSFESSDFSIDIVEIK
jgi:hypothetical protein